jgi:hypothetical protein
MSRYTKILLIIVGGIVLCFIGFYNNYPLVNSDTGTYIRSGFLEEVPTDRPILYGLFIRHVSLADSLYLVIFMQGFLLSLLIYYYFKYMLNGNNTGIPFITYLFIITFFTGISYIVSQIMPHIFTSISMLCFGLLIMVRDLKTRDLIIITFIALISIGTHNSHYLTFAGILFILTMLYLFKAIRKKMVFLSVRRLIFVWGLLIFANLFVATLHYSFGSEFKASRGGHVFFVFRLFEIGILNDYLDECCGEKGYKICEYKDHIPSDFLWDHENSTLYKTGGWEGNKEEYKAIILDVMTTPKYAKIFIMRGIEGAFKQFFSFDQGPFSRLGSDSSPFGIIKWFFPEQVKEYLASRQNANNLDLKFINTSQLILFALSLLTVIVLLLVRIPFYWKFFTGYILICLVMNASVCGAYYVSTRY